MSWGPRRRRLVQRWALRGLGLAALLGVTATLAAALQVRRVEVAGTRAFPARDIEAVLQSALGSPTLTVRPDDLREAVRRVPWVADAQVRISLDGVVACTVEERVPAAVCADDAALSLVDRDGRMLYPVTTADGLPVLRGFAPYPDERAAVLTVLDELGRHWGSPVREVLRLGPQDARLSFATGATEVVVDPGKPGNIDDARRVFDAWMAADGNAPVLLDARVDHRIAVVPAPPAEEAS